MKCSKPIRPRGARAPVPCGQCLMCRINRRRVWTTRMLLEAMGHGGRCCFLSFTYDELFLPRLWSGCGTLYPPDLVRGFKRLRRSLRQVRLRYYAVGEYGDNTWRPHYHVLLFGVSPDGLPGGRHLFGRNYAFDWWPFGHVNVGIHAGEEAITYVAQYTTKKLTSPKDERLATGQYPEFARMSRMGGGGLGSAGIPSLVGIAKRFGFVPRAVEIGKKSYPLGRYLIQKVVCLSGVPVQTPAQEVLYRGHMLHLQTYAEAHGQSLLAYLSTQGEEAEKAVLARPVHLSRVL